MAPHGGLGLVALIEDGAVHGGAHVDHLVGVHAVADGLTLGQDGVIIEGNLALGKELTGLAAAGVHGDVALLHQALIPLHAGHSGVAVDGHGAVLIEDGAAEGPQPGHEVTGAGGVLGGHGVGHHVGVGGLDVGQALLKLGDGHRHLVPAGSGENFGVVDHGDGGHAPGHAQLLAVDVAHVQSGLLKGLLHVVLAQNLVPVGQNTGLSHGVEDADIHLGQVQLLAALGPDEELLGGVGPGPAHPGDGVAGLLLISINHALEDVLAGLFLTGPAGPHDVHALSGGLGGGSAALGGGGLACAGRGTRVRSGGAAAGQERKGQDACEGSCKKSAFLHVHSSFLTVGGSSFQKQQHGCCFSQE